MNLAAYHLPKPLRATVAQAARVCCPEVTALGLTEYVVDGVELHLRALPGGFRVATTAGLAALEAASALAPRTLGRRFSKLPPAEAQAWFKACWNSPLGPFRQLARALNSMIALAFYQAAPVMKRMEYHPDQWIAEVARRRLERYGMEIARHEEELLAPDPLLPAGRLMRRAHHA